MPNIILFPIAMAFIGIGVMLGSARKDFKGRLIGALCFAVGIFIIVAITR